MGKLPAFLFYSGDWLKDTELAMCSPSTRGVWIDALCAMHVSGTYALTGSPAQLARVLRCSVSELNSALDDLKTTKAANVTERNGIVTLASRRFEREIKAKEDGKLRQQRYREKSNVTQPSQESNIPSSVSSSVSSSELRTDTNVSGAEAPALIASRTAKRKQKKPGKPREPDPLYVSFSEAYQASYNVPYAHKTADFVQLAALRKVVTDLRPEDWAIGVMNFLASPLSEHSLADLAVRYATFRRGQLDRFNKPVEVVGNGKDLNGETLDEREARVLREYEQRMERRAH